MRSQVQIAARRIVYCGTCGLGAFSASEDAFSDAGDPGTCGTTPSAAGLAGTDPAEGAESTGSCTAAGSTDSV